MLRVDDYIARCCGNACCNSGRIDRVRLLITASRAPPRGKTSDASNRFSRIFDAGQPNVAVDRLGRDAVSVGVQYEGAIPCFSDEGVRATADNRTAKGIAGAVSSISNLLFFNVYFTADTHVNPYYAYNLFLGNYFSWRYAAFSTRTRRPLTLFAWLPVPVSALERIL